MPDLVEAGRELAAQGGRVVAVSQDLLVPRAKVDEALAKVRAMAVRQGMAFPVPIYQAKDLDALNARFDLPGPIPATIALNRKGEIVDVQEGPADLERLREMARRALQP